MEISENIAASESASQGETVIVQPDKSTYTPSAGQFLGPVFGCVFVVIYLFFIIFFVVMTYKFVRAAERIADRVEKGIVIRKEDTQA